MISGCWRSRWSSSLRKEEDEHVVLGVLEVKKEEQVF